MFELTINYITYEVKNVSKHDMEIKWQSKMLNVPPDYLLRLVFSVLLFLITSESGSGGSATHTLTRIVQTRYGKLQGIVVPMNPARHLKPIEAFLGVPYATPPVAGNRFSPTRTPSPWDGVLVADKLSPVCPQQPPDVTNETAALLRMPVGRLRYLRRLLPELRNQSEDCLYLNIYAPAQGENILDLLSLLTIVVNILNERYTLKSPWFKQLSKDTYRISQVVFFSLFGFVINNYIVSLNDFSLAQLTSLFNEFSTFIVLLNIWKRIENMN